MNPLFQKKVLMLDATLNKREATGITLSNLFGQWPEDQLYMIGDPENAVFSLAAGYTHTFTLGREELKPRFPLNLMRSLNTDGAKNASGMQDAAGDKQVITIRGKFIRRIKRAFVWLGLEYGWLRRKISVPLDDWIREADPDILYACLGTRYKLLFVMEAVRRYHKPLIVHLLDDWPRTIATESFFSGYWNKRINRELSRLLQMASRRVAVSRAMAEEYQRRYGGEWEYYHNPVDQSKWLPFQKENLTPNDSGLLRFAYFGRIGRANEQGMIKFIEAMSLINADLGRKITLDIFSSSRLPEPHGSVAGISCHNFVEHTAVPEWMSGYDFLLLPLSFEESDVRFSRLSVPTKFSEYLMSGIPVVVLAPKETALSVFAREHACAWVINSDDIMEISSELLHFIHQPDLQSRTSSNGKAVSAEQFSTEVVWERFNRLFFEI